MTRLDPQAFVARLSDALRAASAAPDLEASLRPLTELAATLGDPAAASRPGALRDGERDYCVAGVFVVTPDRRYNMLLASVGFPPEQRRLAIPIEWNHPGEVVRTERPIIIENTDEDERFRQFLKTSRMGSSLYHPVRAGGALVGQIVAAAQARNTYEASDLDRLGTLAGLAGALWSAHDGGAFVAADYPAPDLWRAEDHAQ
ncbi:MAG: GAF domain-containing protein [Pseudomonadota bacterium]